VCISRKVNFEKYIARSVPSVMITDMYYCGEMCAEHLRKAMSRGLTLQKRLAPSKLLVSRDPKYRATSWVGMVARIVDL